MSRSNHSMLRLRNQGPLLMSQAPPQNEDHPRLLRGHQLNNAIGKQLPPPSLMRIGLAGPDREDRIEHEDTLPGPRLQTTVIGNPAPHIVMEFTVNVAQRLWQRPNSRLHRKAKSMGVTRGWIGILADEQHSDILIRCGG
ncbi:MAG: hypothetical protein RL042_2279 [Nitrospirota bacterium]